MSAVLKCDGCGNHGDPEDPRRLCDQPWMVVTDLGGFGGEEHACSPECLVELAIRRGYRLAATQDAE